MTVTVPADLRYVRVGLNSLCQSDADKNPTTLSGHYPAVVLADDGYNVELLIVSEMERVTLTRAAFDRTAVDLLAGHSQKTRLDTLRRLRERLPAKVAAFIRAGRKLPPTDAIDRAAAALGTAERKIAAALATVPTTETEARREADRAKRAKLADSMEVKAFVIRKDKATGKMIKRTSELYTVAEAIEARAAYRLTDEVEVAREGRKAATTARVAAGDVLNGRLLPRPGTGARRVVEALLADGSGSTDADLCRLYGYEPGTFGFGRDLKRYAERYGLVPERKKDETGAWRMRLLPAIATPDHVLTDIAA